MGTGTGGGRGTRETGAAAGGWETAAAAAKGGDEEDAGSSLGVIKVGSLAFLAFSVCA